jgi:hypothetical protein
MLKYIELIMLETNRSVNTAAAGRVRKYKSGNVRKSKEETSGSD